GETFPPRLKPDSLCALFGTAEAVPLQNSVLSIPKHRIVCSKAARCLLQISMLPFQNSVLPIPKHRIVCSKAACCLLQISMLPVAKQRVVYAKQACCL
ncbi:MAG: hypothetical protein WBE63_11090, partial [Acidobacteriaceae bacterium]